MKPVRYTMYFFLGIGIIMLVIGVRLWLGTSQFIAHAHGAIGTVIELREKRDSDGDTMYAPVVRFAADGREVTFVSNTSSRPAAYHVGEAVEVLYAPGNPDDARVRGFASLWLGPLVLGGLGTAFTGAGVAFIFFRRAGARQKNYLLAYGTAIDTEFQAIERNTSLEVNGRNPWRIVSQWRNPASGNVRVFNSENLWFDPTQYVSTRRISVLLDPKDERRYHMDVSFLPKLEES